MTDCMPRSGDRGEAHERVARVRDGGVREEPLQVGLPERREVAERHRDRGDDADDRRPGDPASASLNPVAGDDGPASAEWKIRIASAKPAAFGPTERNAVNGVGAPSYTSGHHMCHGTAATL